MNIREMIKQKICEYLVNDGCAKSVALSASEKGAQHFDKGNLKDPYFDSLCHAGLVWAQNEDEKYKFKKPIKVGGKPFTYTKPKTRKHIKDQQAMF